MDDLHQLELLSLVAKISQEVVNYTGINDKTIAEFIIGMLTIILRDMHSDMPPSPP